MCGKPEAAPLDSVEIVLVYLALDVQVSICKPPDEKNVGNYRSLRNK